MTVAMMKSSMTQSEYVRWLRYFHFKRADIQETQLAIIASMVAVGLGNKKASPNDFILSYKEPIPAKGKGMASEDVANFFAGML